jgi:hypothetical protein
MVGGSYPIVPTRPTGHRAAWAAAVACLRHLRAYITPTWTLETPMNWSSSSGAKHAGNAGLQVGFGPKFGLNQYVGSILGEANNWAGDFSISLR